MTTAEIAKPLTRLFSELVDGIKERKGGYVLNTGDIGLLASLDRLSAAEASDSSNGGATIAAHAQHLRYGLSLMNRWIAEGGNPFADAKWDEAWMISEVDRRRGAKSRWGFVTRLSGGISTSAPRVKSIKWPLPDSSPALRTSPITWERSGRSARPRAGRGKEPSSSRLWRDVTEATQVRR